MSAVRSAASLDPIESIRADSALPGESARGSADYGVSHHAELLASPVEKSEGHDDFISSWKLLEAAPDAMLVVDRHGTIRFVNARTTVLFGYERAHLMGAPLEMLIPERYRQTHGGYVAGFFEAPGVHSMGARLDFFARRRDGTEFPVEIMLSPATASDTLLTIAAIRDVTARRSLEEELRRSREDLTITLRSIGDAVITTNLAGGVVSMNPAAERLSGWRFEDARSLPIESVLRKLTLDGRERLESPVRHVLREGRALSPPGHVRLAARDGSERFVSETCAPIQDASGVLRGVVVVLRDQTTEAARVRALDEAARARMELDRAPVCVVRLDGSGRILNVNEAWRKFGLENGADDRTIAAIGLDYLEVCRRAKDESSKEVLEGLTDILAGRTSSLDLTYRCHAPDKLRWYRLRAQRVDGGTGVILIHADVSEYHQAEARLRVQSAVARALAEHKSIRESCRDIMRTTCEGLEWDVAAIWLPDPEEHAIRCVDFWVRPEGNPARFANASHGLVYEHGYGLPGETWATGKPKWIVEVSETTLPRRGTLAKALGLKSGFAFPLGTGSDVVAVVEFFSVVRRFPDQALLLMLETAGSQLATAALRQQAQRESEKAQAAIRRAQGTLQSVLDCAPVFISTVDKHGVIQFINRSLPLQGANSFVGTRWSDSLPSEERETRLAQLHLVFEKGIPQVYEFEQRDGSNGNNLRFVCRMAPLRDGKKIIGAVIVSQDVTDLKRAQEGLAAAQRLAAVGTLAAGVAHELNTPIQFVSDSVHFVNEAMADTFALLEKLEELLQAVASGAESERVSDCASVAARMISEVDTPYLKENVPQALDRSIHGLDRAADIVRFMKELANPVGGRKTLIDINRVVRSTLTICANEYKYVADVETSFGDVPGVVCHSNEVSQSILNILVNAAHAIKEKLGDEEGRGTIRVQTTHDGDNVVISIADSGNGIQESNRSRIFDPFFTTKVVGSGTGQGLSFCWAAIVDRHGGKLSFETEPGAGTTFFIRLPITPLATEGAT